MIPHSCRRRGNTQHRDFFTKTNDERRQDVDFRVFRRGLTYKSGTVFTEGGLQVRHLLKVVNEAWTQFTLQQRVGPQEVGHHLILADQPVSVTDGAHARVKSPRPTEMNPNRWRTHVHLRPFRGFIFMTFVPVKGPFYILCTLI